MPSPDLKGRRVLAIVTNYGIEQDELVVPVQHFRDAGADVTIAAVSRDPIRTLVSDKDPGKTVDPTTTLAEVDPSEYGLLLIPGGTVNADSLRLNEDAVRIVKAFTSGGKPIAAICHGPWALVEADALGGKTLTSYASLRTDIRNAGAASWVDREEVTDDAEGYVLVTSRGPQDLDAFLGAADTALAAA